MINLSLEKKLNIITTNTNRALDKVLKDVSPQKLQSLSQEKDLSKILESIFNKSTLSQTQDKELLKLLKNNPTLKDLSNVTTTLKELKGLTQQSSTETTASLKNIDKILNALNQKPEQETDINLLKKNIENSGVFLESKIKRLSSDNPTLQKELFNEDTKSLLLKAQEDIKNSNLPMKQELLKTVEKLLLQIDYYQLVSHISNTSALYIPYSWDALEDGNITLKNQKDGNFLCDIELSLKEYGSLKLRLGLFEKNQLNINITAQSQELTTLLKENIPKLKQQLKSANIVPRDIRFVQEITHKDEYIDNLDLLKMNFEVKV